jgi:hypothetical protein
MAQKRRKLEFYLNECIIAFHNLLKLYGVQNRECKLVVTSVQKFEAGGLRGNSTTQGGGGKRVKASGGLAAGGRDNVKEQSM